MNFLAEKVAIQLEKTRLGKTGRYIFLKQCNDAKIDINIFKAEDMLRLEPKLREVLPYFVGTEQANKILNEIKNFVIEYEKKLRGDKK